MKRERWWKDEKRDSEKMKRERWWKDEERDGGRMKREMVEG